MLQHLPSRESNRQLAQPAGASLEPWVMVSLLSNMQELLGLRTKQTKGNITAMEIGWEPSSQSSVVKLHPWKTAAMQMYLVALWSTGNPLTGSWVTVSPAPFWESPQVAPLCDKKKAQFCTGTKNSLKYSSNERELEKSRLVFGEGHNWHSGLPWV